MFANATFVTTSDRIAQLTLMFGYKDGANNSFND